MLTKQPSLKRAALTFIFTGIVVSFRSSLLRRKHMTQGPDIFELMLRRQGWHLLRSRPSSNDPKVIQLRRCVAAKGTEYGERAFFDAFGENTFRKLLRHIFFHKRCTARLIRLFSFMQNAAPHAQQNAPLSLHRESGTCNA